MTKPNLLYNSLKVLCSENCLVGAKLDMGMFPVMKNATKEKLYADAEGMGIHHRYMYSILDVRDIMAPDENGKTDKCYIIRLKDPWAGSQEWKGGCSDYDTEFWSEPIKSAFNTRNKLD